jgi:hypothetical protein
MSVGLATIILSFSSFSQSPSPTPSEPDNGYSVTVSTEVGGRWVDVNGSENKFRSDLNYRSGLRLFDSSILIENNRSGSKWFDSALFQGSGWGADPSGNFRANIDRDGQYRFTANIRRVGFLTT